jgi:hypothetical protein
MGLMGLTLGWAGLFVPSNLPAKRQAAASAGVFVLQQICALVLIDFRPQRLGALWNQPKDRLLVATLSVRELVSFTRRPTPAFLRLLWPYSLASFAIAAVGIVGMFYFGAQVASAHQSIPAPVAITKTVKSPAKIINKFLPRSAPTHLAVNRIGISADVMGLGRLADGTMEVPPLFSPLVGWYDRGPSPGEQGPAVIVGHVDTYKGPSVFWRLYELRPGDIIEVTRADKKIAIFRVDGIKQFEKDTFPTAEVYGNLDYAGLRLITCGGTFNNQTGEYNQNTVVFASYVDVPSSNI